MATDLSERTKAMLKSASQEDELGGGGCGGDTFAERAEWYYQKRPQFLCLLQDLYNGYTVLLDRCNTMEKCHIKHRKNSSLSMEEDESGSTTQIDWEAESSLSYQHYDSTTTTIPIDDIIADLVMKTVEKDLFVRQLDEKERLLGESMKKIDLLNKLLEVLESERLVLLNENAALGYKTTELLEENRGLSSEVLFLKRKVGDLARCVLRMREDRGVLLLSRKIEDLQGQIYGLEMRNKEYYKRLVIEGEVRKNEEESSGGTGGGGQHAAVLGSCFQKKREGGGYGRGVGGKWWEKMKSMAICGSFHAKTEPSLHTNN